MAAESTISAVVDERHARLQRGRCSMAAERRAYCTRCGWELTLQRGRCSMAAESGPAPRRWASNTRLQRGRCSMAAERLAGRRRRRRRRDASTRPLLDGSGEMSLASHASSSLRSRFNEAAARWQRRERIVAWIRVRACRLQRGRCSMAAERLDALAAETADELAASTRPLLDGSGERLRDDETRGLVGVVLQRGRCSMAAESVMRGTHDGGAPDELQRGRCSMAAESFPTWPRRSRGTSGFNEAAARWQRRGRLRPGATRPRRASTRPLLDGSGEAVLTAWLRGWDAALQRGRCSMAAESPPRRPATRRSCRRFNEAAARWQRRGCCGPRRSRPTR